MRLRGIVLLLVLTAMVVAATSVFAFDGKRKGFIIGFGLGPGYTNFSQEVEGVESDSEGKVSIVSDFKIGYGFNEQFLLYYENRVSWFKMTSLIDCWYDPWEEQLYCSEKDVTIAHGIGLVGMSYYFQTEAPTFYLLGSVGVSTWSVPFETDSGDAWVGFGISGGGGYEFTKHWSIEGTLNYGNPSTTDQYGFDATTKAFSVLFTITGLAY